jgi:hypothetical protein
MGRSLPAATLPRAAGNSDLKLPEGPGSVVISAGLQGKIRRLLRNAGEAETLERLGVSRTGLLRSLSGLPQRPATILWLSQRMAAVENEYVPGMQAHKDWKQR